MSCLRLLNLSLPYFPTPATPTFPSHTSPVASPPFSPFSPFPNFFLPHFPLSSIYQLKLSFLYSPFSYTFSLLTFPSYYFPFLTQLHYPTSPPFSSLTTHCHYPTSLLIITLLPLISLNVLSVFPSLPLLNLPSFPFNFSTLPSSYNFLSLLLFLLPLF